MDETEEGGWLSSGLIPGGEGGVTSGLGWEFQWDHRDKVYAPYKGHFVRLSMLFFDPAFASDFAFNHFTLDMRKYFNLGNNHVLAFQAYGEYNFGETPFNRMAQLGGQIIMRGYKIGTYRDQHLMAGQIEYRTPIWYFVGFTAFLGSGAVARNFNDFQTSNFRPTYGMGLRLALNRKERINLRLDYARGEYDGEFYLTLMESF
ncbi:BamA/TamA family outer membrane protein [bacterium SCSIO 12741]|nr:BamA/TamA family outer membrane protein [bacterium SCSIO 12741]